MDHYAPHQEWSIVNVTAKEVRGFIWSIVAYEFHLKRYAGIMLTLYVIPVIGKSFFPKINIVYC